MIRRTYCVALFGGIFLLIAAGAAALAQSDRLPPGCINGASYEAPARSSDEIESVITSSSRTSRLYVTTTKRQLLVGTGTTKLHWRKLARHRPGRLISSTGPDDVLYAAGNALFRSKDHGHKWSRLTCALLISDVAISPRDPKTIYLATGQQEVGNRGGGLFRSTDGGKTWTRRTEFGRMHPGSDNRNVTVVEIDPGPFGTVYIGRELGGIDFSEDGGQSWSFTGVAHVPPGSDGPQVTSLALGPNHRLWVGSRRNGIFAADIHTLNWTTAGLKQQTIEQILPDPRHANIVYAITSRRCKSFKECAKRATGSAWRTTDRGAHWAPMGALPKVTIGLTIRARDGALYAWNRRRILRSRDRGNTWTQVFLLR